MSEIYNIIEKKKLDVVNNTIEKSHGLPNECYTSEAYTKIERKKLFEDKWVVIGVASSVPNIGDAKPFDLLGIPIIILRDKKNKIRVFHNVCSHRGYKLLQKNCKIINKKNNLFLKEAIFKSCKIKCKVVNKDEKEKDLRMILNFGHTFAHGFESAKNFSKKLNHGEAVLLGMMLASELSNKKKQLSFRELLLIKKHYLSLKLPMNINKIFKKKEISKIVHFMKKDKKNVDEKINLILLSKIGKTAKLNKFALNSNEIKKFLDSYYL